MSKIPIIDYDYDKETVFDATTIETNCSAITILNEGNCSMRLDKGETIPAGGGFSVSLDTGFGIPRLSRRISIMFDDDNTETPQIKKATITRTIINKICFE